MLTPAQRYNLFKWLHKELLKGAIDSRELIKRAVRALSPQIPKLNRHHAAGMLAALGATFTVIVPGKETIVSF